MFIIVSILLLLSFALIYKCASYSLSIISVYPEVVCEDLQDFDSKSALESAAIREWNINHELERKGVDVSY